MTLVLTMLISPGGIDQSHQTNVLYDKKGYIQIGQRKYYKTTEKINVRLRIDRKLITGNNESTILLIQHNDNQIYIVTHNNNKI